MTSCLLVKAPDRLVAVADGRLSVDKRTVSFDSALKIQRFTPKYRVPIISLGRFDHYQFRAGEDCLVAYAGTYALASEVLLDFARRVSGQLILAWRAKQAVLVETFEENAQFIDDYPFRQSDYPEFGSREVLALFRSALQVKGDEWCANRNKPADVEFLLFGKDGDRRYWAYKISIDAEWSAGAPVRINCEPVKDGVLAAIGSPSIAASAFEDAELQCGLTGWAVDQTKASLTKTLDGLRLDNRMTGSLTTAVPPQTDPSDWSGARVSQRFAHLLRTGSDASVGGELTVAMGGWYGEISVRRGL